jgi:hypothetical protein
MDALWIGCGQHTEKLFGNGLALAPWHSENDFPIRFSIPRWYTQWWAAFNSDV